MARSLGQEVADLAHDLVRAGDATQLRVALNLIAGAASEQRRALARSRSAALTSTAVIVSATGIAATVFHPQHSGGLMRPCFQTHSIGTLLPFAVVIWFLVEFIRNTRVRVR